MKSKIVSRIVIVTLLVMLLPQVLGGHNKEQQTMVFPTTSEPSSYSSKGSIFTTRYSKLEISFSGANYSLETEIWYYSTLTNTSILLKRVQFNESSGTNSFHTKIPAQGSMWIFTRVKNSDTEIVMRINESGINYSIFYLNIAGTLVIVICLGIYTISSLKRKIDEKEIHYC